MRCDHLMDEQIFRVLHGGLYEHFIDRDYAEVPDPVAPSAKYVAIAGDNLLHLVRPMGSQRILRRPKGWERHENDDDLSKVIAANDNFLLVRQYGADWDRFGETWAIERKVGIHEILAFAFGPTPILCFDFKTAMLLGKHCHPNPRKEAQCLRWVPIAA
jgi:hypothetical protein